MLLSFPLCALGKGYYAKQGARGLLRLDFCSATIQIALDYKQGTLASVFICFLGSQAMTNTTLPVIEVTRVTKMVAWRYLRDKRQVSTELSASPQVPPQWHLHRLRPQQRTEALPPPAFPSE